MAIFFMFRSNCAQELAPFSISSIKTSPNPQAIHRSPSSTIAIAFPRGVIAYWATYSRIPVPQRRVRRFSTDQEQTISAEVSRTPQENT